MQKTFLNVSRSFRILSLKSSSSFVFACKFRIYSETLDKVISDLVEFLTILANWKNCSVVKLDLFDSCGNCSNPNRCILDKSSSIQETKPIIIFLS